MAFGRPYIVSFNNSGFLRSIHVIITSMPSFCKNWFMFTCDLAKKGVLEKVTSEWWAKTKWSHQELKIILTQKDNQTKEPHPKAPSFPIAKGISKSSSLALPIIKIRISSIKNNYLFSKTTVRESSWTSLINPVKKLKEINIQLNVPLTLNHYIRDTKTIWNTDNSELE